MTPITRILRSAKLAAPVALAAFVALTIAPAATPAATVTSKTASVCDTFTSGTDWGTTHADLQLPKFNPALGTLTAVEVTQTTGIKSSMKVESRNAGGRTDKFDLTTANATVQAPGTAKLTSFLPPQSKSNTFTAYDGATDYAGTSGWTSSFGDDSKQSVTQIAASDFGAWSGAGTVLVAADASATTTSSMSGNYVLDWSTDATSSACVVYTYTEQILVCIGDYVWIDANKNGIQDAGEQPVPGRSIVVTDANGLQIGTATTDASGRWSVCNLEPNLPCIVSIDLPEGYTLALSNQGTNDTVDSDGVANGTDATINCMTPPRDKDLSFDVGVYTVDIPSAVNAPRATVLRAAKRSFSRVVNSGGVATFSVTVSNPSSTAVRNISVCDTPPRALTFTSRPKGSFISAGRLCWKVASLGAGRSVTFTYKMRSAKVARQVCVVNRVAANVSGSTSAAARASICIRPTKIAALPLAG